MAENSVDVPLKHSPFSIKLTYRHYTVCKQPSTLYAIQKLCNGDYTVLRVKVSKYHGCAEGLQNRDQGVEVRGQGETEVLKFLPKGLETEVTTLLSIGRAIDTP
jgi:hypothetical protein